MDYFLTEEQEMIRDLARRIAQEKILPLRVELDEKEEFPWSIMKNLAEADLFGIYLPEEYGGTAGGCFELCLVVEELSRVCAGVALCFAMVAFALTEANAGSDAGGIQTTARLEGNEYVLNGTKQWITNGGEAEIYTVIAMTDKARGSRGASAFIVEKGTPGFEFGKKEKKLGIRSSSTRELIFTDCKIPKENLLAREGMGFIVAMKTLDTSRPGIGAQAIGIAQGALDEALVYARERIQFGKPIISFQAIQHMMADMATQIEAARFLVYGAARYVDSGAKDISKISAMAKVFASDVAMKVTTDAVQILGGYGYMRDYPVEKMMRDAKITQIYEGTNQIQRNVIALQLIKEKAKGK